MGTPFLIRGHSSVGLERLNGIEKVKGSIPFGSTSFTGIQSHSSFQKPDENGYFFHRVVTQPGQRVSPGRRKSLVQIQPARPFQPRVGCKTASIVQCERSQEVADKIVDSGVRCTMASRVCGEKVRFRPRGPISYLCFSPEAKTAIYDSGKG